MTSEGERKTPGDGPITLINVFEVPAEQVEEFITQLRVHAKIMAAAPGSRPCPGYATRNRTGDTRHAGPPSVWPVTFRRWDPSCL
jgi:hypothetical protein